MSFRRGETDRIREPRTAGVPIVFGYLIEVEPDSYEPTADFNAATHVHALDPIADEIVVAAIGVDTEGVRTYRIGADSYAIVGG